VDARLQRAQALLRRTHTLMLADRVRMSIHMRQARRGNEGFLARFPDFALPPHHLAYDAYANADWVWYKVTGEATAQSLVGLLDHHGMPAPRAVLDWGCGPARIIRHLPALLPDTELHGADYNGETIAWCSSHIPEVRFTQSSLEPPLPYDTASFDCVYCVSVITHLSEPVAAAWLEELARVLKPGGLLLLWANGGRVARALLADERRAYEAGNYVARGRVKEGRKFFLAVHPPQWLGARLSQSFVTLERIPGGLDGGEQDVWVARRR
jgi:SAM-dependent methyltransferase